MENQALFSSKSKSKKLKCRLLQFLFGALRVKYSWAFPRTAMPQNSLCYYCQYQLRSSTKLGLCKYQAYGIRFSGDEAEGLFFF